MIIGHYKDVPPSVVTHPEARGATMRVLLGPGSGWDDHVMRVFELEPGGNTPRHRHDWPHINYIISGQGSLYLKGEDHGLSAGGYALVPAGEEHQFKNVSDEPFVFVCIVPVRGHY
jgi:quercetin dioxygenase-like cupin family protein